MKVTIPKDNELLRTVKLESPVFLSPEKKRLFVTIPQSDEQLRKAWDVLRFYTINTAVKPEVAAQDLDKVEDVIDYHFDPELSYMVMAAVDGKRQPKATAATETASIDSVLEDLGERSSVRGKGIGFIYQIGHVFETEFEGYDFHTEKELYKAVAALLQAVSVYGKENWLGVVTEAVAEKTELRALTSNTGFGVLVPNEFYMPPATQTAQILSPEHKRVTDLVLLGKDVPRGLAKLAAKAYVICAYCKGQDIDPTLRLIDDFFKRD